MRHQRTCSLIECFRSAGYDHRNSSRSERDNVVNLALWDGRVIAWFSCGAASAVNAKLIVEKYGERAEVVNCDMRKDEHEDNERFLRDAQEWLGVEIKRISSTKFSSVDEVFVKERYMAGPDGARCTVEMKKVPRFHYQDVADIHSFGYTSDARELLRIAEFEKANPELFVEWPLRDASLTKQDCFDILAKAGVRRSAMYDLGFNNANCFGCVKVTSPPYWNRVRRVRPDVFALRAKRSRELGVRLIQITINGKRERIFLDELTPAMGKQEPEPEVSCGPHCVAPSAELSI